MYLSVFQCLCGKSCKPLKHRSNEIAAVPTNPNLSTCQLTTTFALLKHNDMKQTLIILAAILTLAACKSTDKKVIPAGNMTKEDMEKAKNDSLNFTTIEWIDSTTRNLGKLKKDESVEVTFRFKNSGDKNLVIEDVTAQCGCTIPEKPTQAYGPGEEGVIKAKFNGSGSGVISKMVTVMANTKPSKEHHLTFTGEIIENTNK